MNSELYNLQVVSFSFRAVVRVQYADQRDIKALTQLGRGPSIANQAAMKIFAYIFVSLFFFAFTPDVLAQNNASNTAEALRSRLGEIQMRREELQSRLQQLEENLKPEKIEASLAGVGSTHPEDLRELRRRQLEREKTSIQTELNQLADSQLRLERQVVEADTRNYQESAKGTDTTAAKGTDTKVERPRRITRRSHRLRRSTRN